MCKQQTHGSNEPSPKTVVRCWWNEFYCGFESVAFDRKQERDTSCSGFIYVFAQFDCATGFIGFLSISSVSRVAPLSECMQEINLTSYTISMWVEIRYKADENHASSDP